MTVKGFKRDVRKLRGALQVLQSLRPSDPTAPIELVEVRPGVWARPTQKVPAELTRAVKLATHQAEQIRDTVNELQGLAGDLSQLGRLWPR